MGTVDEYPTNMRTIDFDSIGVDDEPWCDICGSDWEGMHFSGAYEWDGGKLYQGGECPFAAINPPDGQEADREVSP